MSSICAVIMVIVSPDMANVKECAVNFVLCLDFQREKILPIFFVAWKINCI